MSQINIYIIQIKNTKMNSFFTSTQYKNWIKTEEQLQSIEKTKIQRIVKRINEVNALIKK